MTDDAGAVSINNYSEYGAPAAGNSAVRFQYTGQLWLIDSGLYHYKARAYNPGTGRFMQADPIGYAGGINLYAYANNDPINNVDPLGTNIVVIGHRPKKDDSGEPIDPIYDIEPPTAIETLIVYGERFKRDLESPADFHFDDFDIGALLQAEMAAEIRKNSRKLSCSKFLLGLGNKMVKGAHTIDQYSSGLIVLGGAADVAGVPLIPATGGADEVPGTAAVGLGVLGISAAGPVRRFGAVLQTAGSGNPEPAMEMATDWSIDLQNGPFLGELEPLAPILAGFQNALGPSPDPVTCPADGEG